MKYTKEMIENAARIASDENECPEERAYSIEDLCCAHAKEHETLLQQLRTHSDLVVRSAAMDALLTWNVEPYIEQAVAMFHNDPHMWVRISLGTSLATYARTYRDFADQVKQEFAIRIRHDPDPFVQASVYERLVHMLGKGRIDRLNFNPDKDIDWSLVIPYLPN